MSSMNYYACLCEHIMLFFFYFYTVFRERVFCFLLQSFLVDVSEKIFFSFVIFRFSLSNIDLVEAMYR